jgi:hypothetical protein
VTERGEFEDGADPLPFDSPVPGFGRSRSDTADPDPDTADPESDAVPEADPGDPLPFDPPAPASGAAVDPRETTPDDGSATREMSTEGWWEGLTRTEEPAGPDAATATHARAEGEPSAEPAAPAEPAVPDDAAAPDDGAVPDDGAAPDETEPPAAAAAPPAATQRPRRRPSAPRAIGSRPPGAANALALALAPAVACGLLALAGWAALTLLAVVVLLAQLGLLAAWVAATRPPDPRGVLAVAGGAAVVTDVVLVRSDGASLAPVAGVVGLALGAAMLRQLMRRSRTSVTTALSSTMGAVVLVVAMGLLIVLGDIRPEGPLLGTALAATAAAAFAGRGVEAFTSRGAGGPGAPVPAGVTVVVGTLAGLLAGLPGPGAARGALVGLGVGIAVVLASVTAGPAVRRPGGGVPAPLLLATLLPLSVAAAAAHALGRLAGV